MRLLIHVEGQTEETFVNEVLAPHLTALGYSNVSARLLGNARSRRNRGGIVSWPRVKGDLARHLYEDAHCISTTLVDYYGMPSTGDSAWPGRSGGQNLTSNEKAERVETALQADLLTEYPQFAYPQRFIPFVLMHEFEALLFSDCDAFAQGIQRADLAGQMTAIRNSFKTPEDINDSPLTSPSKRILAMIPNYEKPLLGNIGILEIGLTAIRVQCPHFNAWLDKLEALIPPI